MAEGGKLVLLILVLVGIRQDFIRFRLFGRIRFQIFVADPSAVIFGRFRKKPSPNMADADTAPVRSNARLIAVFLIFSLLPIDLGYKGKYP